MCAYYLLFGVFSTLALAFNLLLLVAVLSMLQATLTLPGIAAIALALGMAIDANVLINERVREELRNGASPQAAIHAGYERAWATILDSNVTTLIAGVALLAFGSGPGARLRGRALPGHPDLDVLGRDVLARPGQPLVRPAEEAQERVDRPGLEARRPTRPRTADQGLRRNDHGILPHPPRHPVHAPCAGAERRSRSSPSLAAVFFLATRGLHLSIEFTGGTVIEVEYAQAADARARCAPPSTALGFGEVQVQNFGTSRDVLIRLPVRGDVKQAEVVSRVFDALCKAEGGTSAPSRCTTPTRASRSARPSCGQRRRRAGEAAAQRVRRARRSARNWPATAPRRCWPR